MEIVIKGEAKELAALVSLLQERHGDKPKVNLKMGEDSFGEALINSVEG